MVTCGKGPVIFWKLDDENKVARHSKIEEKGVYNLQYLSNQNSLFLTCKDGYYRIYYIPLKAKVHELRPKYCSVERISCWLSYETTEDVSFYDEREYRPFHERRPLYFPNFNMMVTQVGREKLSSFLITKDLHLQHLTDYEPGFEIHRLVHNTERELFLYTKKGIFSFDIFTQEKKVLIDTNQYYHSGDIQVAPQDRKIILKNKAEWQGIQHVTVYDF